MKLTKIAEELKKVVDEHGTNYEERSSEVEELAQCMGSEDFGYALYEGGYLKPEEWIEGDDLIKLQEAIKIVGEFKEIVESLHDEF
jgi:hypothetical protein